MAEFKIPEPNTICWRELATKDLTKATDFYSKMFGWQLEQSKITPMAYKEIHMGGIAKGGMMEIGENWGPEPPPSHWSSYVAVEDADATVEKIKSAGGTVKHGPFDAAGIGRVAMVADPSGASFSVIQFAQPQ